MWSLYLCGHTEPEMHDLNTIVIPKIQAYWQDVAFAL